MNKLELNKKTFKSVCVINKIYNIINDIFFRIVNNNFHKFVHNSFIRHNQIVFRNNILIRITNDSITYIIIPTANTSISITNNAIHINILCISFIRKRHINYILKCSRITYTKTFSNIIIISSTNMITYIF